MPVGGAARTIVECNRAGVRRRSPLISQSVINIKKKIAAFGTTKAAWPVKQNRRTRNVTHTTLIHHILLACEDENGENFQADMGTERFADAMDH